MRGPIDMEWKECELIIHDPNSYFMWDESGLDIKHLVYMHIGHVVLKIDVPWKFFRVPSQYL